MKFRKLNQSELKELEKEFIAFLVLNGIDAQDWIKIKKQDKLKAEELIDIFSDSVFSQIFRENHYIDFISKDKIYCFNFNDEEVSLIALELDENSTIDLTSEDINSMLEIIAKSDDLSIFSQSKAYLKTREEEMFDLASNGAQLSNGTLYKQFEQLL